MTGIVVFVNLLLAVACVNPLPQENIFDLINRHFDEMASGVQRPLSDADLTAIPSHTLMALSRYEQSDDKTVRREALVLRWRTAVATKSISDRQRAVEGLVKSLGDSEQSIRVDAGRFLLSFKEAEFSIDAKMDLHNIVHRYPEPESLLVLGAAGMEEEIDWLATLIDPDADKEQGAPKSILGILSFHAHAARARLGVAADAEYVIQRVQEEEDRGYRVWHGLRHLAYTRNEKAIRVVVDYLFSDYKPPAVPGHTRTFSDAQYALGVLVNLYPEIPVEAKGRGIDYAFSDDDVARSREWARTRWPGR